MFNQDGTQIPVAEITPDNIPLDVVKQYLRVDHEFDDLEITLALKSAQSYIRKYIKIEPDELMDFDLLIPVLTLTAFFYENKNAKSKSNEKMDSIILSILDMNRGDIL